MTIKNDILAALHTLIIILAWLSPFWLDWKIVFICLFLYYLQMILFKGCILVNLQFNNSIKEKSDMTMYAYWTEKFGIKTNRKKLKFISSWIMPTIILVLTILWQIILNMPILIRI
jgi:hypothetical protein